MKKKLLFIVALLVAAFAFVLQGCDTKDEKPDATGEYSVTLSDPALQLDVLDRADITATVKNPEGQVTESQVTWTSSDASVVTVSNGTVDALKAGTATITATAEGKSAVCEVTVSAMVRPQIIVTPTDLTLKEGQSTKVTPSVKFKSRTLDNTEYNITYTCESSDTEIVAVTNDGAVSAKKAGNAEITVAANVPLAASAAIDGNLTQKINVTVQSDFTLVLNLGEGADTNIYLKEATDGDVTYKETSQVVVSEASLNGQVISSGWIFKSSDEAVATVSAEGVVSLAQTAEVNDKVKIYAEYQKDDATVKSNEIEFTVLKATLDKALADELTVDLSADNPTIDASLFGEGFVITDVKDGEKPAVSLWNSGSVDKAAVTLFGERTLIVESDKINYRVNAWVVSKVITTAAEITELFSPESGNAVPVVNGYYVLGQDIEAGNATFKYRAWAANDGLGLCGTFDGRGHTVNGLKINTPGGIFGVISSTGTVKNVSFTNVEVDSTGHAVILAYFVHGTVDNVFIGVNKLISTSSDATNNTAGLVSQAAGAAELKNIVLIYNSDMSVNAGNYGALEAKSNVGAWENVFVVSGDKLFGGANTSGDTMSQYGKSAQKFATLTELLASSYYNDKKTEYSGDLWDISNMTFKSSENALKAELNTLGTPIELKVGEATAVVKNSKIYNVTTNASEKLEIVNGTVTALQPITAGDNVTLTVSWGGTSKTVSVTAVKPAVTVNVTEPLLANANAPIEIEDAVFTGAVANVKIDETDVTTGVSVSSGKLIFGTGTIEALMGADKLKSGSHVITLSIGDKAVTVNAVIAWTINTKDELNAMTDYLSFGTDSYNGNTAKTSDGYLVLGADINFANSVVAGGWNSSKVKDYFFEGTFDGRGYGISNMSIGNDGNKNTQMGLFGNIGANGTIKNLRLTNVNLTGNCAAIAYLSYGKIENVYVKGTVKADSGSYGQYSATSLLVGRHMSGSKVNNVIVEAATAIDTTALKNSSVFGKLGAGAVTEAGIFSNCFAINATGATLFTYGATSNLKDFDDANGNKNLADMAAAWNDPTAAGILTGLGVAKPTT